MKGALVNFAAILAGSIVGLILKRGIPETYKETIIDGLGLAVMVIGFKMALVTENILVVIVSIALGACVGEVMGIDAMLNRVGVLLNEKLGSRYGDVGKGFVTATLIFCIGAMAIVGSIQEGLTGDTSTLYAKSMLDGIAAIIFTAAMGIGVAFAAIPVFLYQATITVGASCFGELLSKAAINELTAVGGVLIIAVSFAMLEIKKIRVANLLPAIPIAVLLVIWGIL
jgi:uncharacterized membrane protein YqgA involved in biofilm formation